MKTFREDFYDQFQYPPPKTYIPRVYSWSRSYIPPLWRSLSLYRGMDPPARAGTGSQAYTHIGTLHAGTPTRI